MSVPHEPCPAVFPIGLAESFRFRVYVMLIGSTCGTDRLLLFGSYRNHRGHSNITFRCVVPQVLKAWQGCMARSGALGSLRR